MEDPRQVGRVFCKLTDAYPDCEFGYHVHNLSGMATANILAALDGGATTIEGAICGIGGGVALPSAIGSVGNFPTEDLVTMLGLMGIETGLDPLAVQAASADVARILDIAPRSHTGAGATRETVLAQSRTHPQMHAA
jgi:hydroxymethylglutaryl-CoA lyase